MRPAEAVLRQDPVGIADEVAVGEEQEFDQVVAVAARHGTVGECGLTGGLMALFTIILLAQVLLGSGPIGYDKWAGIFSAQWMKALTFSVIIALLYHVWIGVRDIFMDYVKPVGLRLTLQIFSIVWLVSCAGWAIQILWRL